MPEGDVVSPARLRVYLVDDHDLIRAGQRNLLADRFDVVGEAAEVAPAVEGILATRPDVVLIDVRLGPAGHGSAVIGQVRAADPEVAFLALSAFSTRYEVAAMVTAGALGYLLKSDTANLTRAVEMVGSGVPYFSRELATLIPSIAADLTPTEEAMLLRLARGFTPEEVAVEMGQSVESVNDTLGTVLARLQQGRRGSG